ncbi:glutamate synthase subunit beta [Candidatus Sumerlaeota bacterium]|nr:glutamate synthase subunit beta [Candidatus Sumerlaeota bacterium]
MGNPKGFMLHERKTAPYRPSDERLSHWGEFIQQLSIKELQRQGARCMDCGTPFCHTGCPLGNSIPDWNDAVYRDRLEEAIDLLHATNNFPEVTGRVCPAPCEASCVLGINEPPVTIKSIEQHIADQSFEQELVKPWIPARQSGKKAAIIGSGPAGLAAAQQLARAGHAVTVYERDSRIGGLLRYGIPDFKLNKEIIDRRMQQMEAEGVVFKTGMDVGRDVTLEQLRAENDAVLLSGGATQPRDLPIPGRELKGVYFAMQFLSQQNHRLAGDEVPEKQAILATGKKVVVLGGGDTGSDCLGTSLRQKAESVHQYELLSQPPEALDKHWQWPYWPNILRTSSSQEEGGERDWGILTKEFIGDENGALKALRAVRIEFKQPEGGGRPEMIEVPDSEFVQECDMALLALGFLGPEKYWNGKLNCKLDGRGNVQADEKYKTSVDGVFAAGDMRRGQSLVVWAILEGREAAYSMDEYLMGYSSLPNQNTQFNTPGYSDMRQAPER